MAELIAPTTRLHANWLEAHREWGPGSHEDGFGLTPGDEVDSPAGFAAWISRLAAEEAPSHPAEAGALAFRYRWIVEDGRVLGGIVLRYGVHGFVPYFGHIGYGIRPSARRRGLAAWALGRMLDEARTVGLDRVLVACAVDNIASVRTIEGRGGVLESVQDTKFGAVRRYWIGLQDDPAPVARSSAGVSSRTSGSCRRTPTAGPTRPAG
ncbi:GNAT family N-acetyltransferase [Kitasatospora sp. NPDC005751]|uniref:GNAT family N-acetyltransferase n=1 Tax=Kitasatospora sp. NPDC005751 TaxID=3157064 RepID=UPI0033F5E9F2